MLPLAVCLALASAGSSSSTRALTAAAEAVASTRDRAAETQLVEAGRPGLRALARSLARDGDPARRERLIAAVPAFAGALPRSTTRLLRRTLRRRSPSDRLAALGALARVKPRRLSQLLMTRVADPDPEVRTRLAALLAVHADARTHQALRRRRRDRSPEVREVVLRVRAQHLGGDAQRALLSRGLRDRAEIVRWAAIELAGVTRDPAYSEALAILARSGAPEEARRALTALTLLPRGTISVLNVLEDRQAPLSSAELAFGWLRGARSHALDLILPALEELPEDRRRQLMQPILTDPTDEELADLVFALDHPNPRRARQVRDWLTAIGMRADTAVASAMADARPGRAEILRRYLQGRPGGGVSPEMLGAAYEGPAEQRVAAIAAVGIIGAPQVRENLMGLLDDPESAVRAAAARAVADLEGAAAPLVRLTRDPSPEVRASAVSALERHFDEAAWRARLGALRDPEEPVRLAAIRSLTGSSHPAALAGLEDRILEGTSAEREAAVVAIAESPTTLAAVTLVELVVHPNPEVRRVALAYIDAL
ncbi:MAG: HEAT repeat domain-containing protein [Myxococcota bacterium]